MSGGGSEGCMLLDLKVSKNRNDFINFLKGFLPWPLNLGQIRNRGTLYHYLMDLILTLLHYLSS